ncbi:hypothetical protein GCM10009530_03500 [Microbispora corallina]|uniref:Tyr recombinase domain-containing protein n=1 Tax=Microbispora corallina TaxID=83302 RepID=A0ABQ4FRJ1_9ACTN|nr:hypothetical protein Mco01_04230 [Microbispora corallina]
MIAVRKPVAAASWSPRAARPPARCTSGVDIVIVAEYLGHSDPAFTLRTYTHLMPSAIVRARRAMDAFFNDGAYALDVP